MTGVGLTTPHGADRESSWQGIRRGARAATFLEPSADGRLRIAKWRTDWFGAPAAADDMADAGQAEDEPVCRLAVRAAREAVEHARLTSQLESTRAGCVIGTSKGGLTSFRRAFTEKSDVDAWATFLPNAAARTVALDLGLRGPLLCPVAACATGLVAILRGGDLIRHGSCDVVLAGSSDASLVDLVVGSYRRLGVHSRFTEDPASACRPFDVSRDGFVVGEGAAVLVLEEWEHARRRGAPVLAELLSGRLAADAAGLLHVDESGETLGRSIADLLAETGVEPDRVDHVQLHGTGTTANDLCEARALNAVFGDRAASLPCSSLKGGIGHLMGAAGSVEMAAGILGIRDGVVPPTVNLLDRDPLCQVGVSSQPVEQDVDFVLKISLGFGGHVAVGLLASPDALD